MRVCVGKSSSWREALCVGRRIFAWSWTEEVLLMIHSNERYWRYFEEIEFNPLFIMLLRQVKRSLEKNVLELEQQQKQAVSEERFEDAAKVCPPCDLPHAFVVPAWTEWASNTCGSSEHTFLFNPSSKKCTRCFKILESIHQLSVLHVYVREVWRSFDIWPS